MGFFTRRRERKAEDQYATDLARWKDVRDECAQNLALARSYQGEQTSVIMLKPGEAAFATINGAALIEDRRGPGQWAGRSSGFSFPVGGGIRYRTGASRGHYVQGALTPTAIDTGTFVLTNRRAVFMGAKQTRECAFDKLVGFEHTPDGSTVFSVTNRQKPTTVHYGRDLSGWFDFRLDLALAHYRNELPTLVERLEADCRAADAAKPTAPSSAAAG